MRHAGARGQQGRSAATRKTNSCPLRSLAQSNDEVGGRPEAETRRHRASGTEERVRVVAYGWCPRAAHPRSMWALQPKAESGTGFAGKGDKWLEFEFGRWCSWEHRPQSARGDRVVARATKQRAERPSPPGLTWGRSYTAARRLRSSGSGALARGRHGRSPRRRPVVRGAPGNEPTPPGTLERTATAAQERDVHGRSGARASRCRPTCRTEPCSLKILDAPLASGKTKDLDSVQRGLRDELGSASATTSRHKIRKVRAAWSDDDSSTTKRSQRGDDPHPDHRVRSVNPSPLPDGHTVAC